MDNSDFLKTMGEKIKEARLKQNITVRELGLLCQLDYSNILRMENGQVDPRLSTLRRIAEALDCELKAFL